MKTLTRATILVFMLFVSVNITLAMSKMKRAFPRIAGIHIGAKNYNHPEYMNGIARKDFVLMGYYRGWTGTNGAPRTTIKDNVQVIKAVNPNILIGQYTNVMSLYNHRNHPDPELNDKIESEQGPAVGTDWWAYKADGTHVSSYPVTWDVNITEFTIPDENGDRYPQWYARHKYQNNVSTRS